MPPELWSMTLRQFRNWSKEVRATEHYKGLEQPINMYILNTEFNVPWTANTGSSTALLMNGCTNGLAADVMISHGALPLPIERAIKAKELMNRCGAAWAEGLDEFEGALSLWQRQNKVPDGVAIWICTLSQVVTIAVK